MDFFVPHLWGWLKRSLVKACGGFSDILSKTMTLGNPPAAGLTQTNSPQHTSPPHGLPTSWVIFCSLLWFPLFPILFSPPPFCLSLTFFMHHPTYMCLESTRGPLHSLGFWPCGQVPHGICFFLFLWCCSSLHLSLWHMFCSSAYSLCFLLCSNNPLSFPTAGMALWPDSLPTPWLCFACVSIVTPN